MIANELNNEFEDEYSNNKSAGGGKSIEKWAMSKNFKNLKAKNHLIYRRT